MAGKTATKTGNKLIIRTDVAKAEEKSLEFKIEQELFEISKRANGDVIRLDYAAWGNGEPKYELRIWKTKDGVTKATKGIGLTGNELIALRDALNEMEAE